LVTDGRILQNGPFEKQGVSGLMWIRIGVTGGGRGECLDIVINF
jgi:hypothetical protein